MDAELRAQKAALAKTRRRPLSAEILAGTDLAVREHKRVYHYQRLLASKYGLTAEEWMRILTSQGGGCAICGGSKRLCVDHDHKTGAVRGILCHKCNSGIGMLQDDQALCLRAATYLGGK